MAKLLYFWLGLFLFIAGFWSGFSGRLDWLNSSTVLKPVDLTGRYDFGEKTAFFNNRFVSLPTGELSLRRNEKVLGETDPNKKRIEIDLTNQRLYAYEENKLVYNFLISSGKWGRTPVGTFKIWIKLRYTKMEGGSKLLNTYYYLPNVPYTMFFYNDEIPSWRGYGIHGTYWHNNFGYPMSHGCINMKTDEAEKLYYWANPDLQGRSSIYASEDNPGTQVIIYGKAP